MKEINMWPFKKQQKPPRHKSTVVIVSGYFNPLHSGHLDYFNAAKKLGNILCVIVNNDYQVNLKGATPFMNLKERLRIVKALKVVDHVIGSFDIDGSVVKTLSEINDKTNISNEDVEMTEFKTIFANGGDRKLDNTPEEEYCSKNGIETVYGVGADKTTSSSQILEKVQNSAELKATNR